MSRGGRIKDRTDPDRRCIATGQTGDISGLIRFVISPDGMVVPDVAGRLPGRGLWVSARQEALVKAAKRNLFSRAAKAQAKVSDDLVELVGSLLLQRTVDLLALCRKAGLAVQGFEKVESRLRSGSCAVLIEAADGSERQKAKLRPLAGNIPLISSLLREELGLAFGRENVIHASLDAGKLTDQVLIEVARLQGVRGENGQSSDSVAMVSDDEKVNTTHE